MIFHLLSPPCAQSSRKLLGAWVSSRGGGGLPNKALLTDGALATLGTPRQNASRYLDSGEEDGNGLLRCR